MDSRIKSFEEYKASIQLQESKVGDIARKIKDVVVTALKKIGNFFEGVGSSFLNSLVKQEKNMLPKSVTIFPNDADLKALKEHGESIKVPPVSKVADFIKESFVNQYDDYQFIDEAQVTLVHPKGENAPKDIDSKDFTKLVRNLIEATQAGKTPNPLLIWGAPGIGKTAIINMMAKKYDFTKHNNRMICQDLQTASESDFLLPAKGEGEKVGRSTRLIIDWLPVYDSSKYSEEEGNKIANGPDGKGGIIFFDEIARCKGTVQNVIMKLCDADRRINEWVLGDKWCIIAAANRKSDRGEDDRSFHFDPVLGNRFSQCNYAPSFADWVSWAGQSTTEGEQNVADDIIGFLQFKPEYFHKFDPDAEGEGSVFPSPRKWTDASSNLKIAQWIAKKYDEKFTKDDIERTVATEVGRPAAKQYMMYLDLREKIDMKEVELVYTDPENAPLINTLTGIDRKHAFLTAVMGLKVGKKLTGEEMMNVTKWLVRIDDLQLAVLGMKMLKKAHPDLNDNPEFTGKWADGNPDDKDDCMRIFYDGYPAVLKDKSAMADLK